MKSRLYIPPYGGKTPTIRDLILFSAEYNLHYSVDTMIEKLCNKNDASISILHKLILGMCMGGGNANGILCTVDYLGLYGNRLAMLYEAAKYPKLVDFANSLITLSDECTDDDRNAWYEALQNEIIACKTVDDFRAFIEKHSF